MTDTVDISPLAMKAVSIERTWIFTEAATMRILKRNHVIPFYIPSDLFFLKPVQSCSLNSLPIRSKPDPRGSGTWSGTQFEGCGLRLPTGSKNPNPVMEKTTRNKRGGFGTETFLFFVWKYIYIYIPVRLEVVAGKGKQKQPFFFLNYMKAILR